MKKLFCSAIVLMACAMSAKAVNVATFENTVGGIQTSVESPYWYGYGLEGENYWVSGDYQFATYNDYGYYYDFVVSNDKSTVYTDFQHAYRSAAGGAYEGDNFAVWYYNWYGTAPVVAFEKAVIPGVFVCNCAYTVSSMNYGDGFAKKFGKEDWLKLTISSIKNEKVDKSVEFYLAKDGYYVDKWTYVDLSSLGEVDSITFSLTSTDNGTYGMNTPAYFCIDNFGAAKPTAYEEPARAKFLEFATFEDITIAKADTCWQGADAPVLGYNNWKSGDYGFQTYYDNTYGDYYAAFTVTNETANTSTGYTEAYRSAKGGAYEGANFAVAYVDPVNPGTVTFAAQIVKGFFVNNTAYAVNSMCNGDWAAKKFGQDDWFMLTVTGMKNKVAGAKVEFYLAKDGKYVNEWTYVDLTSLGEIDAVKFSMSSSDNGAYGMNTPSYFAMDNFGADKPVTYVVPDMASFPEETTAVENTNADVKAVKVLRNGQVVIIREGKMFNVMGIEL